MLRKPYQKAHRKHPCTNSYGKNVAGNQNGVVWKTQNWLYIYPKFSYSPQFLVSNHNVWSVQCYFCLKSIVLFLLLFSTTQYCLPCQMNPSWSAPSQTHWPCWFPNLELCIEKEKEKKKKPRDLLIFRSFNFFIS